jgi:hypothetical protein
MTSSVDSPGCGQSTNEAERTHGSFESSKRGLVRDGPVLRRAGQVNPGPGVLPASSRHPGPPLLRRAERAAFFTFRSEPFKARPVTNGDLSLGLDTVGDFTLYLKRQPGASFDKPHSFSDGEPIARFRRASVVMGTTLNAPSGTGLLSLNVFTATLIWSQEFEFGGSRYDLGRLIPHGITQWGDASTTQLAPAPHGFEKVFAFVGSAIALGR